jgi:hypothetical protein
VLKPIILFSTLLVIVFLASCDGGYETPEVRTPEMAIQAKNSVIAYLAKKNLPPEGLASFNSSVKPEPGFSYLYTGNGRCIEIIVLCYGQNCSEVQSYPYDRHGEQCPL